MRRFLTLALAVSLAAPLAGCDVVKRLQNEKVLAGLVLASPGVTTTTPPLSVPGVVGARIFFGEVQSGGSASGATGLAGATAQVSFTPPGEAPVTVTLAASGPAGNYAADSTGTALAYHAGVPYTFRVTFEGETYTGTVTAPQAAEMESPAGTPVPAEQLAVYGTWPDPWVLSRQGTDIAFYTVMPFTPGDTIDFGWGLASCTNAPGDDPRAWLNLLVNDAPYRAPSFSLPREACFVGPGLSAVGLTTVAKATGTALSSNLFLGSGVMVGTSDAAAVVLTPL